LKGLNIFGGQGLSIRVRERANHYEVFASTMNLTYKKIHYRHIMKGPGFSKIIYQNEFT